MVKYSNSFISLNSYLYSFLFSTTCVFVFVNSVSQNNDIGSFLNKLMKEYVPKNTRQYTVYNGQPTIYSNPNPQHDMDISNTLLTPGTGVGSQFMNTLVPEGSSPFLNYSPWNPSPAVTTSTSSPSFFSSMFGRSSDNINTEENLKAEEKSEIITSDDVLEKDPEFLEINMQSTMSF